MKYKVGDKVYLRDDLEPLGLYGELDWYNDMISGKWVTILTLSDKDFSIKEDSNYHYSYEMIDHEKTKQIQEGKLIKGHDKVNHPQHYTRGEIETIDVIEYLTRDLRGIKAVCMGNLIKYVMRCNFKNGWEDVEKAKWYLDKFMEEE